MMRNSRRGVARRSGSIRLIAASLFAVALLAPTVYAADDKSGVGPNVINLPNGPGSLGGLGQTFQPQLNTGAARYTVPLKVNPGVAGHAPDLSLGYRNGTGNGPLGFGWSYEIPCIERRTSFGLPRYVDGPNQIDDDGDGQADEPNDGPPDDPTDEPDKFVNEGGVTLIPMDNGDYFSRYEGAFVRYRRIADYWEGIQPSGVRMEFGLTEQARVLREGANGIARWLLERITDTNGNCITYRYKSFSGETNRNQKYLDCIEYGPGAGPWSHFHFIAFRYEARSDWFENCCFRFPLRTGMRMTDILVGTQGPTPAGHVSGDFNTDGTTDYLARRYHIDYDTHPHWSLISAITPIGADGASVLPPIRFEYTLADPPESLDNNGAFIRSVNEPNSVMDNALVELIDLNADGLPDLLRTESNGGAQSAYLNHGLVESNDGPAIAWDGPHEVASEDGLAWGVDLSSKTRIARLADMNGDGMADLTYSTALAEVFFFANQGDLSWGPRQAMAPAGEAPLSPFARADVLQADLDSNKKMDVIQSVSVGVNAHYRVWFNLGNQVFAKPLTIPHNEGVMFDITGVKIADFNGDKTPDICRIQPLQITILPGLGYGYFGDSITVDIPQGPLNEIQLKKVALRDITGDGLPDLVLERAEPGRLWYWINLGNYSFDQRRILTGMPTGIGYAPTIRWADINGNGTTDLIYADREVTPKLQIVDMGELLGYAPGSCLLKKIDNGIGHLTEIEYRPSTQYAMDDLRAGSPWPYAMPLALEVVSKVTTDDGLGHRYVSEFVYHAPYYDPEYKAFRGFERVEQKDIGEEDAPTQVVQYTYGLGREEKALKGKILRVAMATEAGDLFKETLTDWEVKVIGENDEGGKAEFAYAAKSQEITWECGAGDPKTTETEFAYDNYGNLTRTMQWGLVEEGRPNAYDDERLLTRAYAINLDRWMVRKTMWEEIRDEEDQLFSRIERYYDDPTFSGANPGEITQGNQTLVKEWWDPADPAAFAMTSRAVYDGYGNMVVSLEPLAEAPGGVLNRATGHFREIQYDPFFQAFPLEERLVGGNGAPDLVFSAAYDEAHGVVTRATDPNGHETRYTYDVFGRLTQLFLPGDADAWPTEEYTYVLAEPIEGGRVVNYVEERKLDQAPGEKGADKAAHYHFSRSYEDGLGRILMRKEEAADDPITGLPRVSVANAVRYNLRRKVAVELRNYYSQQEGERLADLLAFEDIAAAGWRGLFHENGELRPLNLLQAHQAAYHYDALLRELEAIAPDGAIARTVYEPFCTKVYDQNDTDPDSPHYDTPVIQYYDGLGRMIQVDETVHDDTGAIQTWTTRYAYDVHGRRTRITDAQGNVRLMAYDGLKRMTSMNDPDRGKMEFDYDAANNTCESRDAKGQVIRNTYDGYGRIASVDYLDEGQSFSANRSPDIQYTYDRLDTPVDLGNGETALPENSLGKLVKVSDLAGEEYFSYDNRGRNTWNVKCLPDPRTGAMLPYATFSEYDAMDRAVKITYPDGDFVRHEFDAGSDLQRITGGAAVNLDATPYIVADTQYAPDGRSSLLAYGNHLNTAYDYDNRGRPVTIRTWPENAPALPLADHGYVYDAMTHMQRIEDRRPISLLPEADPRRNTQAFRYDDVYRLIQAELPPGEIDYRYDRIGNLLEKTSSITDNPQMNPGLLHYGEEAGRYNRIGRNTAAAGPHALTQTAAGETCLYDANGNVVESGGMRFTWDFKDRLVGVESDTMRAAYVYDYTDSRKIKKVWRRNSAREDFPESPADTALYINKYYEVRDSGIPVKYVQHETARIARILGAMEEGVERTWRYRLFPGWNLIAVALEAEDAPAQLGVGTANVLHCFRWQNAAPAFSSVSPGDTLPQGAILWIQVREPATVTLRGSFTPQSQSRIDEEKAYVTAPALEPVRLVDYLPESARLYRIFDAESQSWKSRMLTEISALSSPDAPEKLAPGQVAYVKLDAPGALRPPARSSAIQYYHHDHLGSSDIVTDARGEVLFETAYYPFGAVRHEYAADRAVLPNHYEFLQKERDRESGLHYFDARYLTAHLGRFNSVDPIIFDQPEGVFSEPQQLNPYAYARNNPVAYRDPDGRATDDYKAMAKDAWENWDKMATPLWLAKHQKYDFKAEKKSMDDSKVFSIKGVLYGLTQAKKPPAEYVRCNDKMANFIAKHNLDVKTKSVMILKKGEFAGFKQNMISRQELGEAIDKAANKKIHGWVNKVRGKLGMSSLGSYEQYTKTQQKKLALQRMFGKNLDRIPEGDQLKAAKAFKEAKEELDKKKEAEERKIVKIDRWDQ